MPVGGALHLLPLAVESVLTQDVDLQLVIVNDGNSPNAVRTTLGPLATDRRITILDLPTSRGRYFCDALVYSSTTSPLFTIHDADDFSEPGRYARMIGLLESSGADVVAGGVTHHWMSGKMDETPPRLPHSSDLRTLHPWNLCAIYRRPALKGLMRPDFRVGYDTLLAHILARTATVVLDRTCDYHWVQREGSLMTSPETAPGSPIRKRARDDIARIIKRLGVQRPGRMSNRRVVALMPPIPKRVGETFRVAVAEARDQLVGPPIPVDASDVVVTILTGARPLLLERTLIGVERHLPGLLDTAEVHVLVNGGDKPTLAVVAHHRKPSWVVHSKPGQVATIGQGTSACAAYAITSNRPYWFHLEDDWGAHPAGDSIDRARQILANHLEVSQVRLSLARERWAAVNMVTHKLLTWENHETWRSSPDCHLTQRPFLMRSKDAHDAYPASGEPEAMRRWRAADHQGIAQLVPGCFSHLGGNDSLKKRLGSPA
jgi:hypothetical protein